MATSGSRSASLSGSPSTSQPNSPTDTTHLMSNRVLQRNPSNGQERRIFVSPGPRMGSIMTGIRFPSPRSSRRRGHISPPPPNLIRSVSEEVGINSSWNGISQRTLGEQKASSMIVRNQTVNLSPETGAIDTQHRHSRISTGSEPHHLRTSSMSDVTSMAPHRSASIISDVRAGGLLSRSSTRRSFGREWTRSHWEKVRDLEQESERARRCSKLSSGFAPLMVFGGLVFICIGVSATTNTGKDKEKLKNLSAAPMAMGIFMLALGIFLIASWFGCRRRAKGLEQQLLHGSRRNSVDDNLVQNLISKLYTTSGINRRQTASPTLPGVTLDGVEVLKPQADNEVRRHGHQPHDNPTGSAGCCSRCGAQNASTQVILETTI